MKGEAIMENKQDFILNLIRILTELLKQTTYISNKNLSDKAFRFNLKHCIHHTKKRLFDSEYVMFKDEDEDDDTKDSDAMIDELQKYVRYEACEFSNHFMPYPFNVNTILNHRKEIEAIWRKQDEEMGKEEEEQQEFERLKNKYERAKEKKKNDKL